MNAQKDLIQHVAVLTVAPGYLNFAQPKSSAILHVGLEELRQLLRDCIGVISAEHVSGDTDILIRAQASGQRELVKYSRAFQEVDRAVEKLLARSWKREREANSDIDEAISDLDAFLAAEHWYDIDRARLIQFQNRRYYSSCSTLSPNAMTNWCCASLFFTPALTECAVGNLRRRFRVEPEGVSASDFAPPRDYLWRSRTFAPQSPQSMINYWEAVLPGARRVRIRQMVGQSQ